MKKKRRLAPVGMTVRLAANDWWGQGSKSDAGRVFVEEEGEDGADGGGEEEEACDGEEDAGRAGYKAVDSGDAGASVGEHEAEEGEADPAGDVETATRGGDGKDDHDRETCEDERDDEFEVYAAGVGGEESEGHRRLEWEELEHCDRPPERQQYAPREIAMDREQFASDRGMTAQLLIRIFAILREDATPTAVQCKFESVDAMQ